MHKDLFLCSNFEQKVVTILDPFNPCLVENPVCSVLHTTEQYSNIGLLDQRKFVYCIKTSTPLSLSEDMTRFVPGFRTHGLVQVQCRELMNGVQLKFSDASPVHDLWFHLTRINLHTVYPAYRCLHPTVVFQYIYRTVTALVGEN